MIMAMNINEICAFLPSQNGWLLIMGGLYQTLPCLNLINIFRCEVEDMLQHKLKLFTDNILIYKMEKIILIRNRILLGMCGLLKCENLQVNTKQINVSNKIRSTIIHIIKVKATINDLIQYFALQRCKICHMERWIMFWTYFDYFNLFVFYLFIILFMYYFYFKIIF